MFGDARSSYDQAAKAVDSNRRLESTALSKAARLLEECRAGWNEPGHARRLSDALRTNQRLWSFFQGELAEPSNPLPDDVKVNLVRLSIYVDQRTFEVMADPAPDRLQVLIDINRHLATGLAEGR
jgi:flagellar biosynthesis activator protein FlaF